MDPTVERLDRPLRYQALDDETYRKRFLDDYAPDWLIEAYSSMFGSVREGRFEVVSADIPRLTDEPQQPYAEFIRSAALAST
jgi:NAD(P)H dehydrogenase (quinone)